MRLIAPLVAFCLLAGSASSQSKGNLFSNPFGSTGGLVSNVSVSGVLEISCTTCGTQADYLNLRGVGHVGSLFGSVFNIQSDIPGQNLWINAQNSGPVYIGNDPVNGGLLVNAPASSFVFGYAGFGTPISTTYVMLSSSTTALSGACATAAQIGQLVRNPVKRTFGICIGALAVAPLVTATAISPSAL